MAFFTGTGAGATGSAARLTGTGAGVGADATLGLGGGVRDTGGVLGPADPVPGDGLGELEIVP